MTESRHSKLANLADWVWQHRQASGIIALALVAETLEIFGVTKLFGRDIFALVLPVLIAATAVTLLQLTALLERLERQLPSKDEMSIDRELDESIAPPSHRIQRKPSRKLPEETK
jgi:hypothetical protein